MRRYSFTCLGLLLFAALASGEYRDDIDTIPSLIGYVENEFIVVVKPEASDIIDRRGTPGNAFAGIANFGALKKRFDVDRVKGQFRRGRGPKATEGIEARLLRHYKVRFRKGDLDDVMAAYADHVLVEHVEPIGVHKVYIEANDIYYRDPPASFPYDQWNYWDLYGINAENAWDDETGDPSVVVGVLETGVKYYHSDLGGPGGLWGPDNPQTSGNIWVNDGEIAANGIDDDGNGYVDDTLGYDFVSDTADIWTLCTDADCVTADNDPDDGEGHGTHVAGTIAAITNNARSVAGIAGGFSDGTTGGIGNGCKVMCLRIGWRALYLLTMQEIGVVRMDYAAQAMDYVANMVDRGVNVVAVNCSWGSSNSGGLDTAVDRLLAAGVMVIHAAGNSNADDPDYLGTKAGVMNVGAADRSGSASDFSSYGLWVDVAAPGEGIMSTYHNPDDADVTHMYVALMSGTSMSSPHACGVAALVESKANRLGLDLDGTAIFDIMVETATTGYSGNKYIGSGILNARDALDSLGAPCNVIAGFSGDITTGCSGLTVEFTDQSSGPVLSWEWDFGDGITSTEQSPVHTYIGDGNYTVSLTVGSDICSDVETKVDYISVGSIPVAGFSADPVSGYAPLTVSFTDESVGNPTLWSWDFGDGEVSSQQNPLHTYLEAGVYTIGLTAENACGLDTVVMSDLVSVDVQTFSQSFALRDIPVEGDVIDSYIYTHDFDYSYQLLTEAFKGRKAANRRSLLDHRWEFYVQAGENITFQAAAFTILYGEEEVFNFEYSTDNSKFYHIMPVSGYDMEITQAELPNDLQGSVYIRVVDADHSRGEAATDFVAVDYLCIETEGTSSGPPPSSGYMYVSGIDVSRISAKGKRFQAQVRMSIVDQDTQPVVGAAVSGYFQGPTSESVSDVTGSDGVAVFKSMKVRNPVGTWSFTVTNVEYPGLEYRPEYGVQTGTE